MKKIFSIIIALLGWFAIITQYDLMIENRVASITETTIRFFSFFTILTNILVAIYMSYQSIRTTPSKTRSNKEGILSAITVYITIVGLVYQLILRQTWHPEGFQKIVDELLHSAIPLFVIFYWYQYENKKNISFKSIPQWLIYPICYLVYILLRGSYANFYPYPFMNVLILGLQQVLINAIILLVFFVSMSALFIFTGKKIAK